MISAQYGGALYALVFRGTALAFGRHSDQVDGIAEGFAVEGRGPVLEISLRF
ncbi:MAG: hypothetical protein JXA74_03175 [Anaerolineae bacterium]|nr:hypothetical protein [Anaerolineae bacterium]